MQRYKANQTGIKVDIQFDNFKLDHHSFSNKIDFDYHICSDKQRIQQVILNLVSNALKFTDKGGSVKINCKMVDNGI